MQHPNTDSTKRRPLSKNSTNATVAHSKIIIEKGSLKNSYFNKRDENHCKHIWQKSRDENMRFNISNKKTLAAIPMEPMSHWRQYIGASEASESFFRDNKGRKRPLSLESGTTHSGGGNYSQDQWRERKQSGKEDTHSKYVDTAAPNRGPEFLEQFNHEIKSQLKRNPHRKRVKFNI